MTTTNRRHEAMRRATVLAASALIGTATVTGLADAAITAVEGADPPAAKPDAAAAQAPAATVKAASCWQSSGRWWCNNRRGAEVIARTGGVVGYMNTTTSWFNYRCEGGRNNNGPHPNRWAYTQADNGRWGYMRDGDISSETNSLPDHGRC